MSRPSIRISRLVLTLLIPLLALSAMTASAQDEDEIPAADIVNPEGGAVSITGLVTYTNPLFTTGVAEPVIILEDQAGFVDRNERFLMPLASQTLGQITTDFYDSPFSYSIALPIEPQGTYRDVDNDENEDQGVQIFAVAYWNNTFGDPFLEERDLGGGGWSTAYASTRVSEDAETEREIIGGKFLVYAADDEQGFPTGFGEDGMLFTGDEETVLLPAGYTVVDLDTDPFTFDRSEAPVIDLVEPEGAALVDLSEMGYVDAFNEYVNVLMKEYAFSEYKEIDWEGLREEFLPRFEAAEAEGDSLAYRRALRDFAWTIPDGHVSAPFIRDDFQEAVSGGIGLAIRDTDDAGVIANFVLEGGPADQAGIEVGSEIVAIDGVPIDEAVDNAVAFSGPFSTEHVSRLQKLRYAVRYPLGTSVDVTFVNGEGEEVTETLETVSEVESFNFSSFNRGRTGFELPVEYELGDSGYAVVRITSFFDNSLLTIQLWERMIRTLNQNGVEGLVIDMRRNAGGRGFLADQMAAYFFNESKVLGNTGYYDESLDEFYFDPRYEDIFYLPPEELRYNGEVVVLVGPSCNSACEFFSYDMTIDNRATIVGQYPTGGLGGSIRQILLPENELLQYTFGRAVDGEGNIHIEGVGVVPDIVVPVTVESILDDEADPVLDAAVAHLNEALTIDFEEMGDIAIGESVEGELSDNVRLRYNLTASEGDLLNIIAESDTFDPSMILYSTAGNELAGNDDIGDGPQAGFEELEIPVDLVLVIEVSAQDGGSGPFTLTIIDAAGEASEEAAEGEDAEAAESSEEDAAEEDADAEAGEGDAAEAAAEAGEEVADAEAEEEATEEEATEEEADEADAGEGEGEGAVEAGILNAAEADGNFTVLLAAIEAAGLTEALSGAGPFTVFAPTDAAFEALPEELLTALLNDPVTLGQILLYHVAAGELLAVDLVESGVVTMLTEDEVDVSVAGRMVIIGDAGVETADIQTANGIIHVIDTVLIPPDVTLP